MARKLIASLAITVIGGLFIRMLPDLNRYRKMREM